MKRFRVLKDVTWVTIDVKDSSICVSDVKIISHGKRSKQIIRSSVVPFAMAQTFVDSFKGLSQKKRDGKFSAMIATGIKRMQEEGRFNEINKKLFNEDDC